MNYLYENLLACYANDVDAFIPDMQNFKFNTFPAKPGFHALQRMEGVPLFPRAAVYCHYFHIVPL